MFIYSNCYADSKKVNWRYFGDLSNCIESRLDNVKHGHLDGDISKEENMIQETPLHAGREEVISYCTHKVTVKTLRQLR